MNKKRRQHYVWRYYLTAWADISGNLLCLRKNNVFSVDPKNIAQTRDFYKLHGLNKTEVSLVEFFVKDYWTEDIQQINKNWITLFTDPFRLKEQLENEGMWNAEKESTFDAAMTNIIEDFHSKVEASAIPILNSLKSGNLEVLDPNQDKADFMFFICIQYFRTKKIQNNICTALQSWEPHLTTVSIQNVWSILSFIFATNLGVSLYASNTYQALILKNNTPIPFIAGDQPVINTLADYSVYEKVNELELYYPLSPTMALLFTESDRHKGHQSAIDVQQSEVTFYNDLIFNASEEQIFGNDATVFQPYIR